MKSAHADTPSVLHVVWNLIRGGTEGQCARVAMQLAGVGLRQQVAVFRQEGYFLQEVTERCGAVYHVKICSVRNPRTLMEILRLRCFIQREQFDLVHCWDADAAIFGGLAASWAGVPLITSRRDLGEIYADWKLRLMGWADQRARAVVVNAEVIMEQCVRRGLPSDKVVSIPNMLDVGEFDALLKQPFPDLPEGRWIAVVARLDSEKDVELVIRAAAMLKSSYPDLRFAIAGDGQERARLEALAAEMRVTDTVRFLGDVTSVPALLNRCCVGALTPKANEGLSNTILEYMAAGLPVVATDCGGNRELVKEEETGHLIPIGDHTRAAMAIRGLLDDPDKAKVYGRNARSIVERRYRPEAVAAQFADLYCARANASKIP